MSDPMTPRPTERPLRVLIIEDDAIIGWALRRNITELGHEVCAVVASGEAAIEAADRLRPDLALVDIRLQGEMDGVQAAREIRRRFDIRPIFLTAFINEFDNAAQIDSFGYLVKPYTTTDLAHALDTAAHKLRRERAS